MGGKNHQPCRTYLRLSTIMSRSASTAFAQLEHANIALENLLLAELDGTSGSVDPIVTHLNNSFAEIGLLRSDIAALSAEMAARDYVDLPSLKTIDIDSRAASLSRHGVVDLTAWSEIVSLMRTKTFYGVLAHFDEMAGALESQTRLLTERVENTRVRAIAGELNLVLEENRAGNFKLQFAQLYAMWGKFNARFLASSVLSTELWYTFTKCGSLLPEQRLSAVA